MWNKLLTFFRPKPRKCSACLALSPGLHQVWSGQRSGHLTDQLCTKCLTSRLAAAIHGKTIVFVESLTGDGYTYTQVTGTGNLSQSRMQLALDSMPPVCTVCDAPTRHLWMPQADLDFDAMEEQKDTNYYSIPHEPSKWTQTLPLCDEHIISHLRKYLDDKNAFFLTFRFPDSGRTGYYD